MAKLNMKATGELLQIKCQNAGYKPKDLSILLNIDTSTPYYWFSGKVMPNWNIMVTLSRLLGEKIDDLLVVQEDEDE